MRATGVVVARELMVGGEPAEGWYKLDPIRDSQANLSEAGRQRLDSRSTPGLKAVPVSIQEYLRSSLLFKLGEKFDIIW